MYVCKRNGADVYGILIYSSPKTGNNQNVHQLEHYYKEQIIKEPASNTSTKQMHFSSGFPPVNLGVLHYEAVNNGNTPHGISSRGKVGARRRRR